MSLYNMLFGMNGQTDMILAILGLRMVDVERFRNCFVDFEAKEISIYTRTGGGNRDDYPNATLTGHACYIDDEDDDFDNTYATFRFSWPADLAEHVPALADFATHGVPAPLVKRLVEMSQRKTEADMAEAVRKAHLSLCDELRRHNYVVESNGHSIFVVDKYAVERIFATFERDESWHGFNVRWCKMDFDGHKSKPSINWTPDEAWFKETAMPHATKYPKAFAYFSAEFASHLASER